MHAILNLFETLLKKESPADPNGLGGTVRFGHFFYPMSLDPSKDSALIEECQYEAGLVEESGLDAIWLSEHRGC